MQKCNALSANPKAVGASVLCIGTNGVRRPFFATSESDNQAGDAGFEQEALKALEKLDAVQPVVPTTGDAARDETADV